MQSLRLFKWTNWRLAAVLVSAAVALSLPAAPGLAATPPPFGMICTTNGSGTPYAAFTLTALGGTISLSDGNSMYMWGYAEGGHIFQHPSPTLCVTQGQTVTVVLHNTLSVPVSIMFPGQTDVLANNRPVQPEYTAGTLTSLVPTAPPGGDMTYDFVAKEPGTYLYESGTDSATQVQMGLFGALVVRPAGHPDWAYNRIESQFNPNAEFLMELSAIDPYQHQAVQAGRAFDIRQYRPRYWMLNGRSLPDTLYPNYAPLLPFQPYSALARIYPYDPVTNPRWALTRYVSVTPGDVPFHPHGNNGLIIARDGRYLQDAAGDNLAYSKFSMDIGPGQTWDTLYKWQDIDGFASGTHRVEAEVTMPSELNLTYGMLYSGSPYLGNLAVMPPGTFSMNMCGEYYIISHSHALYQVTAWGQGLTMQGFGTFLRVDPPLPNSCPN